MYLQQTKYNCMNYGTGFNIFMNPKMESDFFSTQSTDKKSLDYAQSVFRILDKGSSVRMEALQPTTVDSESTGGSHLIFQTSGTTGQPKYRYHTLGTLREASLRLESFFNLQSSFETISCLPIHHVGGWMQVMRAWFTQGKVLFLNFRDFKHKKLSSFFCNRFVSLVPTQLHELVQSSTACENLKLCKGIFLGGASCSEKLLEIARLKKLPIYMCYGMTETAGMVSILSKEDFLDGTKGVGREMPNVSIRLDEIGRICIKCKSLPVKNDGSMEISKGWLTTADLGSFINCKNLKIIRRIDDVINTGGEKVFPALIEKQILVFPSVRQCKVSNEPDERWGQKIVAYISPESVKISLLKEFLKNKLKPFEIPKKFYKSGDLSSHPKFQHSKELDK